MRVLAAAIKQAVTGYGRASKIQVQEMTKVILACRASAAGPRRRRPGGRHLPHAPQQRRHARRARAGAAGRRRDVIASVRGTLAMVDGERAVIEVGGLGLEVLASGRTLGSLVAARRRGGQPVHVPQRARGRAAAVRVPRTRRAHVLPLAHGGERSGAQGRPGRALRLSGGGARAGGGAGRRQEVREHPRHRQEARAAARGRAEGQGGRAAAGRRRRSRRDRPPIPTDHFIEARSALQNLGLTLREAEEALRGAPEDAPVAELVKFALTRRAGE